MQKLQSTSLLAEIRIFVADDFDPRLYLPVLLFLVLAIALNYSTDFTNSILFHLPFNATRLGAFFFLFAAAYYLPALLTAYVRHDWLFLKSRAFWMKSLSALFVVSLNVSLLLLAPIVRSVFIPDDILDFVLRCLASISGTVIVIAYALIMKVMFDKNESYGLGVKNIHLEPYILMVTAVSPLILLASFQQGFLHVYPTYRPGNGAAYLGVPSWMLAVVYEMFYVLDFLFVELFFRGILVIAMIRIMGRHALLPMVVLYTFIHFGKPLPEALTSAIGGFVLGVVAYSSRSVIGGFIVHAGVALLMELFAAVQHSMRGN